ncbi:arginine--tRNA ligase [Verrucomicrobiota bacterium]|nr:arginine--tRNA ligase [Verrucomicrobiota bacterium]
METIQSILASRLAAAAGDTGGIAVTVQSAQDTRFGDYQSNVAMQLAKPRRANPRQLATEIIAKLQVDDLCETPEIAGAGFINFRLKPATISAHLSALAADDRLGTPLVAARRLVVDFSSPNVAKPMHVGHIRSTILGDSLARIGRFLGHTVVADNHIGDWGTQFGMLCLAWKTLLERPALDLDPIAELERIYKIQNERCKTDPTALDAARAELVKLQSGDEENLGIWREMIRLSQAQFDTIYARLAIRFDHVFGESHYNPWLKQTVAALVEKGIARESDGALCVFSDGSVPQKDDPFLIKDENGWKDAPALVQKADGAANYTTTDLATLDFRRREFSPDEVIYVTDGRQQLHFRQLFAIWRRWQPESAFKLSHVWFGSIMGEDGKPFKTRSGDTVKLGQLLDEAEERAFATVTAKSPEMPEAERRDVARIVGIGAVKYADLLPNRQSDYVFSWDKMLSFQGNTAPYLQYSYVRIRSIFRKGGIDPASVRPGAEHPTSNDAVPLTEAGELSLAKKLAQFGEILPMILDDHRPNLLCNYLYELAGAFHSFFESCPVLKAEEPARSTRLLLCDTTARVLAKGLELLGIGVPERM